MATKSINKLICQLPFNCVIVNKIRDDKKAKKIYLINFCIVDWH